MDNTPTTHDDPAVRRLADYAYTSPPESEDGWTYEDLAAIARHVRVADIARRMELASEIGRQHRIAGEPTVLGFTADMELRIREDWLIGNPNRNAAIGDARIVIATLLAEIDLYRQVLGAEALEDAVRELAKLRTTDDLTPFGCREILVEWNDVIALAQSRTKTVEGQTSDGTRTVIVRQPTLAEQAQMHHRRAERARAAQANRPPAPQQPTLPNPTEENG